MECCIDDEHIYLEILIISEEGGVGWCKKTGNELTVVIIIHS